MSPDAARASPDGLGNDPARRRGSSTSGSDHYETLFELIHRVSAAAELDDGNSTGHPDRIGRTSALLAWRLGLDERRRELLRLASPLHDIGKIALPDALMTKPGPLTAIERRSMEQHTVIGHRILSGSGSELLELAATIALTHHERFDGGGYPQGLAREAIPLEGRIVSAADVFDALTSDRAFRPAFAVEEAVRLMEEGRGARFDPAVLDAFADTLDDIVAIEAGRGAAPARAPAAARRRASGERHVRRRRAEPQPLPADRLALPVLESAAEEALSILRTTADDRHAIDGALAGIFDLGGSELLPSVYVREHDRLWCLTQKGYEEMRDGFPLDRGVMARALRTGEAQLVPDVRLDRDFVAALRDLRSELAIPLGDLGVLNLETTRLALPDGSRGIFGELARELVERIESMQASLGYDIAGLARLFVYASSLRGTGAIAEFSTRTLGRLLDLESAQLSLGRAGAGYSVASFWRGHDSHLTPLTSAEIERVQRLVDVGETAISVVDLEAVAVEPRGDGEGRWLVWLPLLVAGDEVGVLVGWATHPLTIEERHVEAATLFAPHAAALIDVAQALRWERRAAVTDSLTGLLNRRGFEQRFGEELERAERARRQLAVTILDCDGLKAINDRGGHELGDSVLLHVARRVKAQKRSGDVAARLGGDEFALLMPEIDADGALAAAERLRRSLADEVLGDGQLVTATFGVAIHPPDGGTASDLLRAADRALYLAKKAGRNRTLLFSQTLAEPAAHLTDP